MDTLLQIPPLAVYVITAGLGLIFGSFVTALTHRLPRGQSIAEGRSRCPACHTPLSARDLIPVVSWILSRGSCRHCGARVSWRYPAIELVTATAFIAAVFLVEDMTRLGLMLIVTPLCVALAVVDIEHEKLPNALIIFLALLALISMWTGGNDVLFGLGLAALVLVGGALLSVGYKALVGRNGLGFGDVKLFAVGALALPLEPFLIFMTLTGVLGVAFGAVWQRLTRRDRFPFGPAILLSFWLCLAAGDVFFDGLVSLLSPQ